MALAVHRVTTPIRLGDEALVDLFFFQWHTPFKEAPEPLSPGLAGDRAGLVADICGKLAEWVAGEPSDRPIVIVAPELSFPVAAVDVLVAGIAKIDRPIIALLGLECLTAAQYDELLPSAEPICGTFTRPGPDQQVNAALIILREPENSDSRRFLQPKRHLARPEETAVFEGSDVLWFESDSQEPGVRFNFIVQICADFIKPNSIRDLRTRCNECSQGSQLDFCFVLQLDPNPGSDQWLAGAKEYFAAPVKKIETANGTLVFVNCASKRGDNSQIWGKSGLLFRFTSGWRRVGGYPTYWVDDDRRAHDHQAAIVREPTEGIYRFEYRPHYLQDRTAGSGLSAPIRAGAALFLPCDSSKFLAGGFRQLPAFKHWLYSAWAAGRDRFEELLEGPLAFGGHEVPPALDEYDSCRTRWSTSAGLGDTASELHLRALLAAFSAKYFPTGKQAKTARPEPMHWIDGADPANRLAALLTCLSIADDATTFSARPDQKHHAVANGEVPIGIVWARGKSGGEAADSYDQAMRDYGMLAEVAPRRLLLVAALDAPCEQPAKLKERIDMYLDSIAEEQGKDADDITDSRSLTTCYYIADSHLFNAAGGAPSGERAAAMREVIAGVIG